MITSDFGFVKQFVIIPCSYSNLELIKILLEQEFGLQLFHISISSPNWVGEDANPVQGNASGSQPWTEGTGCGQLQVFISCTAHIWRLKRKMDQDALEATLDTGNLWTATETECLSVLTIPSRQLATFMAGSTMRSDQTDTHNTASKVEYTRICTKHLPSIHNIIASWRT